MKKLDDYEFLMKIHLERNVTGQQEELFVYLSPSELMYKVYNEENMLLSIVDISLRYNVTTYLTNDVKEDKLSESIESETKKFMRNKKLEQI